ncbi:MAG: hypothetical protein QGG73_08505 [Candidatus Hydrogenedentes bacterium]|jgi:hypothetical protein|nr:hypothetical protein [Candidatus Hydrogenedentota bacterium]
MTTQRPHRIALADYEKLEHDMKYEDVCKLLHGEGTLLSHETEHLIPGLNMNHMDSDVYEWKNADGSFVRVLFTDDTVNDKTHDGLK